MSHSIPALIPLPASITTTDDVFSLTETTTITFDSPVDSPVDSPIDSTGNSTVNSETEALRPLADELARLLQAETGLALAVHSGDARPGGIHLTRADADPDLGDEGYSLTVTGQAVTLRGQPAGLFYAAQTLAQLPVPAGEGWTLPGSQIRDWPRFTYRGMMLDVSRHFFGMADVKRLIDLLARYKINVLHLHLSDDQGWRLMIESWPKLAQVGGSTAVNDDPGGYFTQADYREIVAYAQARFITIVPEFDMPGHTNAVLATYPELTCDGVAPDLYTGTEVGFSSLCMEKEITYKFVDDVVREVAALTPGPFLHIGGDEAHSTPKADYIAFITRVQEIVRAHGKRMVGWEEISQIQLAPDTVAQQWFSDGATRAAAQGAQVIVSPASRIYLDMKYHERSPLGLNWAGNVSVEHSYDWNPAEASPGVGEDDILGVEAPLWTETIRTFDDLAFMVFPRLLSLAEIGWTPQDQREWADYRTRLAAHGPRLDALDLHFYRASEVDWEDQRTG